MDKKLHFVVGLPRAGQTILYNVLAQNPRFHITSPGGVLNLMALIRSRWNRMITFKATPNEEGKERVLSAILDGYYADVDKPVIFDHSPGWLSLLEMADGLTKNKPKVLVCVRDMRDVLATLEANFRSVPQMKQFVSRLPNKTAWQTPQSRCALWIRGDQPVGLAFNQIKDAITRGYRDRLHFVHFDKLTQDPKETMKGIYTFLEEEEFGHDFENVKQVAWENYTLYGIPERHKIPAKIAPVPPLWPRVLGQAAEKYAGQEAW